MRDAKNKLQRQLDDIDQRLRQRLFDLDTMESKEVPSNISAVAVTRALQYERMRQAARDQAQREKNALYPGHPEDYQIRKTVGFPT